MKKIINYALLPIVACTMAMAFTACSNDKDDNKDDSGFDLVITNPIVDNDNYPSNTVAANYSKKNFGEDAIDGCAKVVDQLSKANNAIQRTNLTEQQESYLREMGAASDFDVDPTIDSWPLNRILLLNYFNNGMNEEMLEDATILGFHALEFILFRDGQPRKVAEFKANDTYKNFEKISGAQELAYAQTICTLLKQRCFQLQVAWEGETSANAQRVAVVKNAKLEYMTEKGLNYGQNLTLAGSDSRSTFPTLKTAISQVLSDNEGSCCSIATEVGTAKIANPFSAGDISYVESPYSYNSIADFRDNIRSIRNIWLGSTDRKANRYSFHTFFASTNNKSISEGVENAYVKAITDISNMPAPFVKYVSVIWNKAFEDDEDWDVEE